MLSVLKNILLMASNMPSPIVICYKPPAQYLLEKILYYTIYKTIGRMLPNDESFFHVLTTLFQSTSFTNFTFKRLVI